jgi:hypothetical protein
MRSGPAVKTHERRRARDAGNSHPKTMATAVGVCLVAALAAPLSPTVASEPTNSASACKLPPHVPYGLVPVSLAVPVPKERLAGRSEINVLIVRFELTDGRSGGPSGFNPRVSALISRLSRGTVSVNARDSTFVYRPKMSLQQWAEMVSGQHAAYMRDESKGTWGFLRKAVAEIDVYEDLSKVDSIILQGNLTAEEERRFGRVYEAFQTTAGDTGFLRPIQTQDGILYNAVLQSGSTGWITDAHELLHNFGLMDLYGGPFAAEERAEGWSLMASDEPSLFYWERWQLGWIDDHEVLCLDARNGRLLHPIELHMSHTDRTSTKLIVIRTEEFNVIAVELRERGLPSQYEGVWMIPAELGQSLLTYEVQIDRRPGGIKMIDQPRRMTSDDLRIGMTRRLGEFELMVTDAQVGSTSIALWSTGLSGTADAVTLRGVASAKALQRQAEAAAKAEAERVAAVAAVPIRSKISKTTITCVKGKTIKKVTAIKPKCPVGHRKLK